MPLPEPPKVTFFVDRALGSRVVAEGLRAAGELVEVHDDHFGPATTDTDWIGEVGKRGWVVLTKDTAIGFRHIELIAVRTANVAMFTLASGSLSGQLMANAFVAARIAMRRLVAHHERPFIAKVQRDGSIKLWKPASDLYKI